MTNNASDAQEHPQRSAPDQPSTRSAAQHPSVEPPRQVEQPAQGWQEPNPFMLLLSKAVPVLVALVALGLLVRVDKKHEEIANKQSASSFSQPKGSASAGTGSAGTQATGLTSGVKAMTAGTIIASFDAIAEGRDYTLQAPTGTSELEIKVWDYAAEDGDVIQLRVNGQIASQPLSLMHAPISVKVPVGKLEVLGLRDGGGGITYAINFPAISTSITNSTRPESLNQYHFEAPGQTGARP
ncbi:hypothetical protein [Hyalangium gracile]|uniref:hypothetical protein n=1 Tax=Hyalangium gracile TaxID=394092 RepID=UPI001CCE29E9|nr:hypothetical protein [Hyalangium gracile]